jgi:murein L,D-transpeptidase YafK
LNRRPLVRSLLASAALVAAVALSGCNTDGNLPANSKAMKPLSAQMVADIDQKGMEKGSPILVRLFKQESELEVWKQDRSGRYALLKTYPICRWSGELGPKIKEGDRQAPEGFYTITRGQMNPNSQFYLSFDLGYPNAFDRSHGRTGMHLMVHGDCSSRGCYSMTDEQIAEIYALGREAFFGGQRAFQVQAYPFRMTPQNFAKHRNNPHMAFWKMLKQGNDHFEATRHEPKVDVCEKRYVFDAEATDGGRFVASNKCPVFQVPDEIVTAVQNKQRKDEFQTAELIARGTPVAPVRTNADGGMHPVFADALKRKESGSSDAPVFSLASTPGTIPATVRPPRTPDFPEYSVTAPAPAAPTRTATVVPDPHASQSSASPQPAASNSRGLGSLFSSGTKTTAAKKADDGPVDQIGRLIGLRGSESAPQAERAKPAPAAPAVRTAAPGAIRPKPVETKPVEAAPIKTAEAERPAPPAAPASAPAAAQSSLMSGAAPTVPAGSFENRWPAFR